MDTLAQMFHLTPEQAQELWLATLDADRAMAIRTFGYPKDNHIPPPLGERLRDPVYRGLLLEEIQARLELDPQCPMLTHIAQALQQG